MLRILVQYLLPFLLPFALYFAYMAAVRERKPSWLDDVPWVYLSIVGLILFGIASAYLGLSRRGSPEAIYVPPHMEDGRLVPGRTIEPPG